MVGTYIYIYYMICVACFTRHSLNACPYDSALTWLPNHCWQDRPLLDIPMAPDGAAGPKHFSCEQFCSKCLFEAFQIRDRLPVTKIP